MNVNICNKTLLPPEYQQVEYIQSSGTQYIDTGIYIQSSDIVNCKFEVLSSTSSMADAIYGCYQNTSGNFFVLLMRSPTQARVGTSSNQASSTNYELNKIYDTTLTNGTYIENGVTYTFTSSSDFTQSVTFWVLSRNQNNGATPISAKLYSIEIVDKFNGIPCYRKSDNEIGLYDTVSGTFFTNAGTGVFIKGNDVRSLSFEKVCGNILISRLPQEYQEVNYIESTGNQYIQTNISISSSDRLKFAITPTHTNNTYEEVLGTEWTGSIAENITFYVWQGLTHYFSSSGLYITQLQSNNLYDIEFVSKAGQLIINNNSIGTLPITPDKISHKLNLFGTESEHKFVGKLHPLNIINSNDIVTHQLIPCYRKADNEIGLYDLINSGKNLFDYNGITWEDGVCYSSRQESLYQLVANENYKTTDYIDILEAGETYTISFLQASDTTTSNRLIFFDANKQMISAEPDYAIYYPASATKYSRTITAPAGTKYIRYSVRNTDEEIQIEKGTIATTYEDYPFYINVGTGVFTKGNDVYITKKVKLNLLEPAPSYDRVFGNNTPAQISQVSADIASRGLTASEVATEYGWNLGDTINITLTTNEVIQMQIIGVNHDTLSSDHTSKAGLTLQMKNCLNTRYAMNSTNTNAGGWQGSDMRTTTLPAIYNTLPSEWKSVIKMVDKKAANGGNTNYSTTVTTSDNLFLLAEKEIFGSVSYAQDGANEGTQYDYWASHNTANDRIKYYGKAGALSTTLWWGRSSSSHSAGIFCSVANNGDADYGNASKTRGVTFGFCV